MPFTVTVHLPRRRATAVDVEVALPGAEPGPVTLAQLRRHLSDLLGEPVPALHDASGPLDDSVVVGHPPLVHGASLAVAPTTGPHVEQPLSPAALLDVVVTGGPDCGHRHPLRPGGLVLGRDAGADLTLDDPDLSRAHARLTMTPSGAVVEDLGSTNGVLVDGSPIGAAPRTVDPGCTIRAGSSTLRLRRPGAPHAPTVPGGDGTIAVHRPPRVRPPDEIATIEEPAPPTERLRYRMPWLSALAPLPVAGVVAMFLGVQYLLFAVTGPLMVLGSAIADHVGGRRSRRVDRAAYARARDAQAARLEAALVDERRRRQQAHPDPAEILAIAIGPGRRLWERGWDAPDRLVLRVGTGSVPARTRWVRHPGAEIEHPPLPDAPVTVDLASTGSLGIVGEDRAVLAAGRALIGQIAVLHTPRAVRIWPVVPAGVGLGWLSWLPHTAADPSADGLLALARARTVAASGPQGPGASEPPRPWEVVVVDARAGQEVPEHLRGLLSEGPALGITVIVLASDTTRLPSGCRAVLEVARGDGGALRIDGAPQVDGVRVDGVGWWWAERLARSLAPLRDGRADAGGEPEPPDEVRLPDILGFDPTDPAAVRAAWGRFTGPVATLGATSGGPWRVALRTDGPHLLIGGMTGSGKSELLQCLVASLAATAPPEEVSFVLIDYKGGSAFSACGGLPHTVGVVTDLDDHLAARALTSLRAELTRRERLLAAVGARDLDDYETRRGPDASALGRLVIIIDEFRLLADELPDFMTGIVRIAAVGRSLGVHLVLATQRPTGIVSADIRANVNLRIALRVRDRADSLDVLEAPDAAFVTADRPGRGLARAGGGPLVGFQAARVSAPARASGTGLRLRLMGVPAPPTARDGDAAEDTDLGLLVAAVRAAQQGREVTGSACLWLPPLPALLTLADLHVSHSPSIAVGLVDLPERQRQEPLVWEPTGGHWLLIGAPRSGRTTAALSIVLAATSHLAPESVHVHGVDPSGGLGSIKDLPHTGTVIGVDDLDLLDRLVDRLHAEVRRRATLPPGTAHPAILLVIDGWDRLGSEPLGSASERLVALLREGAAVGLLAVITGDRSLLLGRLGPLASTTLLLGLTDPVDAALAGLGRDALSADPPPGRAVRVRDGAEVQLAVPGPEGLVPALGPSVGTATGAAPIRLRRLPGMVLLDDPDASPPWTIGLGGDAAQPVTLDPDEAGRLLLICGPRGSGRTTALATLGRAALQTGRAVAVVEPRGGSLVDYLAHAAGTPGRVAAATAYDIEALVEARRRHPDLVVLVDDADAVAGTPSDPVLLEISRLVDRDGGLLIAATTPSEVLSQVRGVAVEVARRQRGLLISPSGPSDGSVFGLSGVRSMPRRPGRGLLVTAGEPTPTQVALPPGWPDGR